MSNGSRDFKTKIKYLARKFESSKKEEMERERAKMLKKIPNKKVKEITLDNVKEFQNYKNVAVQTNNQIYFY